MTGKERFEAAFSPEGSQEIPVVIPYEGIYVRDHWDQLVGLPWWYQFAPELDRQIEWRSRVIERTDQDWISAPRCEPREDREDESIDVREDGVFKIHGRTGRGERLIRPQVASQGSWLAETLAPDEIADTKEKIDAVLPPPEMSPQECAKRLIESGEADLGRELSAKYRDRFPVSALGSPLWRCYMLWGFEPTMTFVAMDPELAMCACERYLEWAIQDVHMAAALGAKAIWVEECLTDMIGPGPFASINLPIVQRLFDEIRAVGMKGIYYYTGSPHGKWDLILESGADALAFEESKKNFTLDIEDVVRRVSGKFAVFGNLDAIGVLQDGSDEELRQEIERQINIGRENGGRFVMCLGSPVTPGTPVERVQLYCDLAGEIGEKVKA